mmetsp:Transcript_2861/g.4123  ORF Transcript_2861/g.4123 Transcript_2861/m.4123 type:complete len:185 (+) Transcript_2861:144-698(+)
MIMVMGIPNVGKSTIINKISKKRPAKTGDMPGLTRQIQPIRIKEDIMMYDTPGVFPPQVEEIERGYQLILANTISDKFIQRDQSCYHLAEYGLYILEQNEKEKEIRQYYHIKAEENITIDLLLAYQAKRERIKNHNRVLENSEKLKEVYSDHEIERLAYAFIKDIRRGAFGGLVYETEFLKETL